MVATALVDKYLADPHTFSAGIPHDIFRQYRQEAPVIWSEDRYGNGFWSVTRFADVVMLNRDVERLCSGEGVMSFPGTTLGPGQPRMLIEMDAPEHIQHRKLVNQAFTIKQINQLEPLMRQVARESINKVREDGACDFVADIAAILPMHVITQMMGCPMEDQAMLVALSDRVNSVGDAGPIESAIKDIFGYAENMIEAKSCPLREDKFRDMSEILLSAKIDGHSLSETDFKLFFLLLLVAGNETTRTAIAHAILAFCEAPDQWQQLQGDRSLMESAIDEILRFATPVHYMARTASTTIELGGQRIKPGDRVVLWYSSAHFDESVFDEPMKFDISRQNNQQIAFGAGGPHYCLGANLGKLEIRVMLEELLAVFSSFELAGKPDFLLSIFSNGLESLPIRFQCH